MAHLVGRHLNKIDKKGRVSVPKLFRAAMHAQGFAGIYVFPYYQSPTLEGAGEAFMQRLTESFDDDLDLFSEAQDDFATITLEDTYTLPFDPEGRVTLPPQLREHAGLTNEALFVGRGTRFRIWEPNTYAEHRTKQLARIKDQGLSVSLGGTSKSTNPTTSEG